MRALPAKQAELTTDGLIMIDIFLYRPLGLNQVINSGKHCHSPTTDYNFLISLLLIKYTLLLSNQAWIQNCTVKENITFHLPLDESRYQKAVDACALRPDLDILPAGLSDLFIVEYRLNYWLRKDTRVGEAVVSN